MLSDIMVDADWHIVVLRPVDLAVGDVVTQTRVSRLWLILRVAWIFFEICSIVYAITNDIPSHIAIRKLSLHNRGGRSQS